MEVSAIGKQGINWQMEKLFANHTAVISGGLGDIGYATALEFASLGCNIAIGDLAAPESAVAFIKELKSLEVGCLYNQVDVSDPMAVKIWLSDIENNFGAANIIVANAATVTLANILEITPEQWSREMSVNLHGAFYLTRFAASILIEKHLPGRIVFVGSWAGTKAHPHIPAYSVSKAGLNMLCKCMALEFAPHQILVNEIAPGFVAAGLTGKIWKDLPGQQEKSTQQVPVKKVISAKEVAEKIVFLCHPENIHMTGSTLLMDGGLSLL
jgi:glucose 1-dehydrogenase